MAGPHRRRGGDHAGDHAPGDGSARVPFWVHQVVELLLGLLLLVQGARTGEHTAVLVTLGSLLVLLSLCSDGALAAWPWIGRRLHRVLDLVAAAVLALSPLALGVDQVLPIVILELAAAAMVWLALRTEWRTRVKRVKPTTPPKSSAPPMPPAPPTPISSRRSTPAVPLARKAGSTVGKVRDDGPRQLGRLVGRARRAAQAAKASDPAPPSPSAPAGEPPEPRDAAPQS
jgi:hypothetical protein